MRSEFQYFMNQSDHTAFDDYLLSIDGVSIKFGEHFDEICLGEGFIQYERCHFQNGVLTSGRIAIASTDLDGCFNFSSHEVVEALYRKLGSWLMNCCINTLVCYIEKSVQSTTQVGKIF